MTQTKSPLPRLAAPPRRVPWRVRKRLLDQRQRVAVGFGTILIVAGGATLAGIWVTDEVSGRGVGLLVGLITLLTGMTIIRGYSNLFAGKKMWMSSSTRFL